jgi:hypothetical protein
VNTVKKRHSIVKLSLFAAVLCLSGLAAAQRMPTTEIVGGSGGSGFSDPEPAPGARVIEVQLRSGDHADSVQLVYMLADGRAITGPQHGGGGGGLKVFHLDADEYLVGISGRAGAYIDSIRFETNKRTSPTFGGTGGNNDFRIEVPRDAQVISLSGRAGSYLDAIGLNFAPIRTQKVSGFGNAQQPGQTNLAGGMGGSPFVDGDVPEDADVAEVRIQSGDVVDSVQMIYSLPNGRSLDRIRHGGGGGNVESFRLRPGEYIIGISGRCGAYVDSMRIQTNMRTSQLFGGGGGDMGYQIEVPQGNQARGFVGRSGEYLDAIGLTFARISDRQRRPHERGRENNRDRDNGRYR